MCERFGFKGARGRTLVRDLSGGERRRLQLMRLLMDEPNVLVLDEPTNDLDIETLNALEDLLDGWPGTLIVVSHDRYFVERVCDNIYALDERGAIGHLPGGIDQYLELRGGAPAAPVAKAAPKKAAASGFALKETRKEVQRLERELADLTEREQVVHELMIEASSNHTRLIDLYAELNTLHSRREAAEDAWLEASEALDA